MNRKQRRQLARSNKGSAPDISDKMTQFQKLPEQCTVCSNEFDRKNREMLQTWNVVVRQDHVRLFCPDCMKKAKEVVEKHGGLDESQQGIFSRTEEDPTGRD